MKKSKGKREKVLEVWRDTWRSDQLMKNVALGGGMRLVYLPTNKILF